MDTAGSPVVRPLRLPLGHRVVSRCYRLSTRHRFPPPTATGPRSASPVAARLCDRSTPNYAGGSLDVGSQTNDVLHGLHHRSMGSASSRVANGDRVTTLAQASLHGADRPLAPPRFDEAASRPTPGASLPGTLASPRTELPPASRPAPTTRLRHHRTFLSWRPSLWAHTAEPGIYTDRLTLP